jgi:hypothetical protein
MIGQSIFGLWILNHESPKIIKLESNLMKLNMMLEINSFICTQSHFSKQGYVHQLFHACNHS